MISKIIGFATSSSLKCATIKACTIISVILLIIARCIITIDVHNEINKYTAMTEFFSLTDCPTEQELAYMANKKEVIERLKLYNKSIIVGWLITDDVDKIQ